MTPQATDVRSAAPAELLADLRAARSGADDQLQAVLDTWGLRPLSGGRNNHVYAWAGPDGDICIKIYRKNDGRRRSEREWHALSAIARHGTRHYAPTPLWLDDQDDQPALGMSLVPGTPITDLADISGTLKALAEATRAMQTIPLAEPLASLDRIDSAAHYMIRLTDVWPQQLADHPDDPQTPTMRALLSQWERSGDADILARPAPAVFSRGDSNLLNWHHAADQIFCVDFEFAGRSDVAVDAADHTEHISARDFPDDVWRTLEADLGVDHNNRARFEAAQRTIALRWLAALWKQRDRRVEEFTTQLQRVQNLFN